MEVIMVALGGAALLSIAFVVLMLLWGFIDLILN